MIDADVSDGYILIENIIFSERTLYYWRGFRYDNVFPTNRTQKRYRFSKYKSNILLSIQNIQQYPAGCFKDV